MKRAHLSSLLATLAVATLASLAYAQTIKPPGIKSAPPGINLKSINVTAKCGEPAQIQVAISYSKILVATKVTLWGSIGTHTVDIPTGTGEKTLPFKGLTLNCSTGSEGNLRAAILDPWVVLGDRQGMSPGMMGGTFTSGSSTTYVVPE